MWRYKCVEMTLNDERRNRVYEKNLLGMAKLSNLFTVGKQWCRKRFQDNLSLVHQFQVFLKTWNRVQIMIKRRRSTYPLSINSKFSLKPEIRCKSSVSDCYNSSEINFIQLVIKLHKFILEYILSKHLHTIILNFWFILYIT